MSNRQHRTARPVSGFDFDVVTDVVRPPVIRPTPEARQKPAGAVTDDAAVPDRLPQLGQS